MSTEVGTAYVAVIPSAKGFARNLQKEIAKEFASSNLDKEIAAALGNRPIKLPVRPDFDEKSIPDEVPVPENRRPKVKTKLDPLMADFQQQVKRDLGALAKQINAEIPVGADTAVLRSELAAQIASIESQISADIPTEPAGRAQYETNLRALVQQASDQVKANIKVDVDPAEAASEARTAARVAERAAPPIKLKVDVDGSRLATGALKGIGGILSTLASGASTVTGAASSMLSSISGLVTALLGLAAAASFSVSGVYLLGGILGSLPGIAAGAAAAIGALAIGFMGISDAFQEAGSSGGGAGVNLAAQARQVAQATRGVESAQRSLARAQREVVEAQNAVTRARASEVERLQDLNRSVKRARLDEEEAALRVRDAEADLSEARRKGNVAEIERADLAYRQALLGVEDAKDATEDLTAEQAKSAKVGVDGSEQVQDAMKRQRDAIEGVTAAQEQLLSAQEALQAAQEKPAGGGGGGAAQELMRLAPAAQDFVDKVKSLKPAFEDLRLSVQQRLFAGLGDTVKRLATVWFPQLKATLGSYADTFNSLAKRAASSLSQKSFIDNIAAGAESARKALSRIGEAVSGPLIDAFGRLARAAGPFIERVGDELGKLIEDFSAWIARLDKSGELDSFFNRAGEIFSDLIDMGRDIFSIFGSVMTILFGEQDTTNSPWEALKAGLDDLAAWFKDPQNQQKIRDFIEGVKDAAVQLGDTVMTVAGWVDKVQGWIDKISAWKQALSAAWEQIKATAQQRWDEVIIYFAGLPERFATALTELPGKVQGKFVEMAGKVGYALGQAIGAWINNLITFPGRAVAALRALPDMLAAVWRRAQPVVMTAVSALIATAIRMVHELPGKAVRALGDLGSTLLRAGRALIDGLIRGIREKVPQLEGLLQFVSDKIPDWKGPYDRDKVLLRPAGQAIMTGLVAGISDQVPLLRGQLGEVTDVIAGTSASVALDPASGAWARTAAATPAPAAPTVVFGGDAPDSFIRWLRDNVRVYHGGDANAAFGRAATPALAAGR
ncbi:phage tail protein [Micromonospora sp. DT227]|uniref:phage tail protein n=1 Tax=Micromonospora sp. DT227 TaxID=3393433 RepID=UPI003CFB3920